MRRRIGRAAIICVLGIATFAYGALEKRVTVRVEGTPISLRTFAGTVSGALERAGVPVGERDLVQPSPRAAIDDGSVIRVRRAKQVNLVVDGRRRTVVVTGLTIHEVLDEIELEPSLLDRVSPPRATRVRAGMTITYQRARAITVKHDGKKRRVVTNASTVGRVIDELGIDVRARDIVQPALHHAPSSGMAIKVMRVGVRREIKHVELGYETILRRDKDLDYGERRVVQGGRTGLKQIRYRTKYVDGKPVSRRVLGSTVVRHPLDRVIAIGSGPSCSCTSGEERGKGTWYAQADGMTAAHKTLPMGTVVRVENLDNGRVVHVKIADRGPYGDGRIIDLSDEAFARLAPLSKGVINVRIRW